MKKSTMVALGCGAGAVACIALAVHFRKRRQTGGAVACGVVGGCAAVVAAGAVVRSAGKKEVPRLEYRGGQGSRLETNLGSEYAVEQIEIAHEGLEVDNDLAEVRNGVATPVGENFSDLKVSSPWGYRESFSTSKGDTLPGHNGMDFVAEKGTRVNAVMDGTITYVDSKGDGGYGKVVVIKHETGAQTLYGHLDRVLIDTRQFVQAGEQIGTVGSTGKSTGPHLHLGYDGNNDGEFSREDIQDNPASILYGGEW